MKVRKILFHCVYPNNLLTTSDAKTRRTFREWLTAFIENDEAAYYQELYEAQAEDDDFMSTRRLDSDHEDGYYDDLEFDIDEGMLEGLLIVGLAATLLVLVYIRQQQQRNRQNQNAANQANGNGGNVNANANANNANGNANANVNPNADGNADNDRGFFPRPGDPEFGQWVAGGVGH